MALKITHVDCIHGGIDVYNSGAHLAWHQYLSIIAINQQYKSVGTIKYMCNGWSSSFKKLSEC